MVTEVHAVLLSGGSAFGLSAATGVMEYLEERGVGFRSGAATVPIVPAAILNDLGLVSERVRPGAPEGRLACQSASDGRVAEGSVGVGTGATVAKLLGRDRSVKGGVGTASVDLGDGLHVGAIVGVNAIGGVVNPETGEVVAGPRGEGEQGMRDSMRLIVSHGFAQSQRSDQSGPTSTTIGVVATNAALTKPQASKLASVAHDGIAMAVRPAHLMGDGDTMFALATGMLDEPVSMDRLCAATALSVSRAIVRAVLKADSIGGVPAVGLGLHPR
jgi:L-aminopeptidase/D-esterase-like protein